MTTPTEYGSLEFTEDMDRVANHLRSAFAILGKKEFREHIVATERNFTQNGLNYQWAGIMMPLSHVIMDFDGMQKRIIDAG
jgi:hypothetical protein